MTPDRLGGDADEDGGRARREVHGQRERIARVVHRVVQLVGEAEH